MLAQRQAPAESSHIDTSQHLPNQFSPDIDQKYGLSPPGLPGVSCLTDHGPLPTGPPTVVNSLASIGVESKYIFFLMIHFERIICTLVKKNIQNCEPSLKNHKSKDKLYILKK